MKSRKKSKEERTTNRLNVLKKVAFRTRGATKPKTGNIPQSDVERVTSNYQSIDDVREAFAAQNGLLEDIAEAGYIDDASVDELGLTELHEPAPEYDGEGVMYGARSIDGRLSPEIRYFRNLDDGVLTVAVIPEHNDGYAVLNSHDTEGHVEIQSVDSEALCDDSDCGSNKCCNECGYVCCNCCGCGSCYNCYTCTCGMCYGCVDCQCCDCGWNCLGECF